MLRERWRPEPCPEWVTCIPSLRHPSLVPDFAERLAGRLGLPYVPAIQKAQDNEPQKMQLTRFHQCRNLDGAFSVAPGMPSGPVLLVDDIVDPAWTMTVAAALPREAGAGRVWPMALVTTSTGD